MANPEHLKLLHGGSFDDILAWHKSNPGVPLDWSGANLSLANLSDAPLGLVDLSLADLSPARLCRTDLCKAALTRANVTDATLVDAKLVGGDLIRADLSGADLRCADFTSAILDRSNLRQADLRGANLERADLVDANLSQAKLGGANLTRARCARTIFADTDLSEVKGLESVEHLSTSTLGLDTLQRSKGRIPEKFLRGCGIPDSLIDSLRGRYRIDEFIGPWLLRERLGSGGNGEVWKAQDKGEIVALKILRSRDPKGEAFARFRSEVAVLRSLEQQKGILPLIDASLPETPSRDEPAWLAMPPAITIKKAYLLGSGLSNER